jgi:hypothetical protein
MAQTQIVVSAPLFYGRETGTKTPKEAMSAEHFVDRVNEMKEKNQAWDEA